MKTIWMLSAITLLAGTARAGTVSGKLSVEPVKPERTVVYLEPLEARPAATAPKGKYKLSQKGAQFSPPVLPVALGSEVDLSNDDFIDHSVYSMSLPKVFDLGQYGPSEKKTLVFDKPGKVEIGCFIHEQMGAVILVLDTPYFARPEKDGRFTFKSVAPGKYRLHIFEKGADERTSELVVPAQGTVIAKL